MQAPVDDGQGFAREIAAAFAGGRLERATAAALQELLPGVRLARLAVEATPDVLLVTSSLLAPGHLTLALQPRAAALAGRALDAGHSVHAKLQAGRAAWEDLVVDPAVCRALAVPVGALPATAAASSCLPVQLAADSPCAAGAAAAAAASASPASSSRPVGGQRVPAAALLLGSSCQDELSDSLRERAEQLAGALAPHLAAAAPRVVHEVVTAFLGARACVCGCRAAAASSSRPSGRATAQEEAAAPAEASDRKRAAAESSLPGWSPGGCRGSGPPHPDAGSGSGALSAASSGNPAQLDALLAGCMGSCSEGGGAPRKRAAESDTPKAVAQAASLSASTACSASSSSSSSSESHSSPSSPCQKPAKAGSGKQACSGNAPTEGGGCVAAARARSVAQGWLLGFDDPALERRYSMWHAANKLQLDAMASLIMVTIMVALGLMPQLLCFWSVFPHHLLVMLALALPPVLIRGNANWYARNREWVAGALQLLVAAYAMRVWGPRAVHMMPRERAMSTSWFLRLSYAEGLILMSVCFRLRLRSLVPLLAVAWTIALRSLPTCACALATAPAAWPGCVGTAVAAQLAVGIVPSLAIHYWTERASRTAFLQAAAA